MTILHRKPQQYLNFTYAQVNIWMKSNFCILWLPKQIHDVCRLYLNKTSNMIRKINLPFEGHKNMRNLSHPYGQNYFVLSMFLLNLCFMWFHIHIFLYYYDDLFHRVQWPTSSIIWEGVCGKTYHPKSHIWYQTVQTAVNTG